MSNNEKEQSSMDSLDNELESYGVFVKPDLDDQNGGNSETGLNEEEEYLLEDSKTYSLESDLADFDLDSPKGNTESGGSPVEEEGEIQSLAELDISMQDETPFETIELNVDIPTDIPTETVEVNTNENSEEFRIDSEDITENITEISEDTEELGQFNEDLDLSLDQFEPSIDSESTNFPQEASTASEDEAHPENSEIFEEQDSIDLSHLDYSTEEELSEEQDLVDIDSIINVESNEELSSISEETDSIDLPDIDYNENNASEISDEQELTDIAENDTLESITEIPESDIDISAGDNEEISPDGLMDSISLATDISPESGSENIVSINDQPDSSYINGLSELDDGLSPDEDLLKNIEQELSNIKTELLSLKQELRLIRTADSTPSISDTNELQESEDEFISDQSEDFEVSLTEDELDNILTTADDINEPSLETESVTNAGEDYSVSVEDDLADIESLDDDDGILVPESIPLSDEPDLETPIMEEPSIIEEESLMSDGIESIEDSSEESSDSKEPLTEVVPEDLKQGLKDVLHYMDNLFDSLPAKKIEEFAKSEHYHTYKRIFEELGL